MPSLDVVFAWTIATLAGAAVIGALVAALVWEWFAICRTIERHRRSRSTLADPSGRWWRERAHLTVPERRP
jgi:hypothetical protein